MRRGVEALILAFLSISLLAPTAFIVIQTRYLDALLSLFVYIQMEITVAALVIGGLFILILQVLHIKLNWSSRFERIRLLSSISYMYLPPYASLMSVLIGQKTYFLAAEDAFFSWVATLFMLLPLYLIVKQIDGINRLRERVAPIVAYTILQYTSFIFLGITQEAVFERETNLQGVAFLGYKSFLVSVNLILTYVRMISGIQIPSYLDIQIPPQESALISPPPIIGAVFVIAAVAYFHLQDTGKREYSMIRLDVRKYGLEGRWRRVDIFTVGLLILTAVIISLTLPIVTSYLPVSIYPQDLFIILLLVLLTLVFEPIALRRSQQLSSKRL